MASSASSNFAHLSLVVTRGSPTCQTCQIILRREGDTLHDCGTYGPLHPRHLTDKVPGAVSYIYTLKRVAPADKNDPTR